MRDIFRINRRHRRVCMTSNYDEKVTNDSLDRVEEELRRAGVGARILSRWNVSSTGALKFGCHFLLYAAGKDEVHSQYGVLVCDEENPVEWLEVIGLTRLCHSVCKDLLVAKVGSTDQPIQWTTVSRWKPHIT